MNKVDEIKVVNRQQQQQRISAHSHIRGLGVSEDGSTVSESCGLIGQVEARKVISGSKTRP